MASSTHSKNKVCYYYDRDIGNYYYGRSHPMKPHRIRMTHDLLFNYGLYRKMEIYRPHKATAEDMTKFHSEDYIRFLRNIRPDNMAEYTKQLQIFNVKEDCPVFNGLYQFCQLSAGGSVAGAVKLNKKATDIAINWAGGLHHAKKSEASGFCYVNDIVLAILELLKYHQRVLYIDIDIHHGDGVEEAFFTTDRVMTVSFHKFGEYFPGTGDLRDIGAGKGKYYAVNFPLKEGIDDKSFESIFKPIMTKVMETYQPSAVVLQCGADSLTEDRLGCFNLTLKGHASCVEFVKKYNLPLLLLGGGGYTIRNVARCWTYETAVALGTDIVNQLPFNDYFECFGPNFELHISPSDMANLNTPEYLNKVKTRLLENLRMLPCAPGVQMQAIPEDGMTVEDPEEEEKANPDERISIRASDKRVANDNEFSDSEDEGEGGRRDQKSFNKNRAKQARQEEGSRNNGAAEKKEESVKDKETKDTTPVIAPGEDKNSSPVKVEGKDSKSGSLDEATPAGPKSEENSPKEKEASGNGASKVSKPQAPVKSLAAEGVSSPLEVDSDSPQKETAAAATMMKITKRSRQEEGSRNIGAAEKKEESVKDKEIKDATPIIAPGKDKDSSPVKVEGKDSKSGSSDEATPTGPKSDENGSGSNSLKEKEASGNGASKVNGAQTPVKSLAAEDVSSPLEVDSDSPQKEKETTAAAPTGTATGATSSAGGSPAAADTKAES